MHTYIHNVNYYETDKMGITHHSNYIRWMEEARTDFLKSAGYGIKRLEAGGVTSPVVAIECQYKHTTTFDDKVKIDVKLEKYTGVKLIISYVMTNQDTGELVFTAKSTHCFINKDGIPVAIKKKFPEFDEILKREAEL